MADKSHIEWTDATWNPVTGCSVVTPGCTNCYAMKLAGTRLRHHPSRKGLTIDTKAGPVWNGVVRYNEGWLTQPMEWKKPRMIFVCAHGDLFHEDVPSAWIDNVFAVMALSPQHTFQVLTKRSARMREYLAPFDGRRADGLGKAVLALGYEGALESLPWPLPNVWLGVSTERQEEADVRIPDLLDTPAAVRFISAEPLLGPIDLTRIMRRSKGDDWTYCDNALTGFRAHKCGGSTGSSLDWVIIGGESGNRARPTHPIWVRDLRDQCAATDTAMFFKQWGGWVTEDQSPPDIILPGRSRGPWAQRDKDGGWSLGDQTQVYPVSKKKAGRLLDGVEHNGMPVT